MTARTRDARVTRDRTAACDWWHRLMCWQGRRSGGRSPETGVFVPGLMGAGILLSIVMLVSDGLKKLFPVRGERARAAKVRAAARGRAHDLLAVGSGRPPQPARIRHVPRTRSGSLVLGVLAGVTATAVVAATEAIFHSDTGVLAERGWTLGAGYSLAAIFSVAGAVWLTSALLGNARPRWLEALASWPPLGGLPYPEEAVDPLVRPVDLTDLEDDIRHHQERHAQEATTP